MWSLLLPGAHDTTQENLEKAIVNICPANLASHNPIETLGEENRLSCPECLGSCQAWPLALWVWGLQHPVRKYRPASATSISL